MLSAFHSIKIAEGRNALWYAKSSGQMNVWNCWKVKVVPKIQRYLGGEPARNSPQRPYSNSRHPHYHPAVTKSSKNYQLV